MSSLFLVGNINERTFANAALAAHIRSKDLSGSGLSDVFVLHSPQSEQHLALNLDWKDHLSKHGLDPEIFTNCTVDLHGSNDEQLERVARHVERFLLSLNTRNDVYVDLTNGSSAYKSVLSNIAFVLGVRRQFILDTRSRGFLDPTELRNAYVELPDPSALDAVAPAWLTEVRRFNVNARKASQILTSICGVATAEQVDFELEIENAVRTWFRGEKSTDGAALGGAVRHVGRAFEEMIRGVHEVLFPASNKGARKLHTMLGQICSRLSEIAPQYESHLMEDIWQLLRRLRNASTHARTSPDFGRISARLSTELLLATADYLKILYDDRLLDGTDPIADGEYSKCSLEGRRGQTYYFGIDGDDTGRELELLFQSGSDDRDFARFSTAIDAATKAVSKSLRIPPINGTVLFRSGDDVLFKGEFHAKALEDLRLTYARVSGGQTCSMGYGRTPKEAYVAMKIAKATPGKNSIKGIELLHEMPRAGKQH